VSYTIRIEKQAAKTLRDLDATMVKRIHARLKEIAQNPYNPRISNKLAIAPADRRSRVGDWRIFYEVDESTSTIYVVALRPRGRAYREL